MALVEAQTGGIEREVCDIYNDNIKHSAVLLSMVVTVNVGEAQAVVRVLNRNLALV